MVDERIKVNSEIISASIHRHMLEYLKKTGGIPVSTRRCSDRSVGDPNPSGRSAFFSFLISLALGALCTPLATLPSMARQRLGQHFLADLHRREEIARAIRVSPHSTVPLANSDQHCWIEIGSGHGEMTQHLLATGSPVHAIE